MLKTILIEIRDRLTLISAMVSKLDGSWLCRRIGFDSQIILTKIETMQSEYDFHKWGDRTMHNAHKYVNEHFDELFDGAVIDVEYILGEIKQIHDSDSPERGAGVG